MKTNKPYWQRIVALASLVLMLLVVAPTRGVHASTATFIRPISEFVNAQGTHCFPDGMGGCTLFVPPIRNFFGFDYCPPNRALSVDYAGLAESWIKEASGGTRTFGTTTSGTVTETPLPDGTAEVNVVLHTHNALTWASTWSPPCDFAAANFTGPLVFGRRAPDVCGAACPSGAPYITDPGQDAALGDSLLRARFIVPNSAPGAPLPDLLGGDYTFQSLNFTVAATGTLRAASGLPEGTPGHVSATLTCPNVPSGARHDAGGFCNGQFHLGATGT